MSNSRLLRRFLGVGAVTFGFAFVILLIFAGVQRNVELILASGAAILLLMAFLWPWVYLQGSNRQLHGLGSDEELGGTSKHAVEGRLSLPGAASGAKLVRRHWLAALMILVLGVIGLMSIVIATTAFSRGGIAVEIGLRVGIFALAISVIWASLFRYFYLRPLDVTTILSGRDSALAWGQSTCMGLHRFLESSDRSLAGDGLRKNGYVVLANAGLEFWQRDRTNLERIFTIPISAISAVDKAMITGGMQDQPGVIVHVTVESGAKENVPIILKGVVGGWRAWSKAPDQFLKGFADLTARQG